MFKAYLNALKEELRDLPGKTSQIKMAPQGKYPQYQIKESYKAAVLIILYPGENTIETVLMKRQIYNGPHSGQISFPGGKCENQDKTIYDTALRESYEEIGLPPDNIIILGHLTPLTIPKTNMEVWPILGAFMSVPSFIINATEVDYLIQTKITDFLDDKHIRFKEINDHPYLERIPYYQINNEKIWGATAMIISELADILKRIPAN